MPAKKRKKKRRKIAVGPRTVAAVLVFIVALAVVLTGRIGRHASPDRGDKVPPGSWDYGIDLSHHNAGPIRWDSIYVLTDRPRHTVRNPFDAKEIRPVRFVCLKATEGTSLRDKDFETRWKEAARNGMPRCAYHFFRSSKDGALQAEHFIRSVGSLRKNDLPPVLDIETLHRGCTKQQLNERALQWLQAVEAHYGKTPVVYTGASFAKDHLGKEITERYPLWIAHYRKDRPAYKGWTLWQCTDRAVVKGVPGKVDLSVLPAGTSMVRGRKAPSSR